MRDLSSSSRPLRSWLFVPGGNERFVAKLAEVRPDAVVLDLEDGVGADGLDAARARVEKLLAGQGGPLPGFVALRTHAADHRDFADDVRAIGPELDALILPKVASASDVETASGALRDGDQKPPV